MTPAAWNELAAATLSALRDIDPERYVVIGPAAANSLSALDELRVPNDERVLLTVHYYEPFRFTHQGAWWEPGADRWVGTTWGDAGDRQAVIADIERVAAWAQRHLRRVFIGEFGVHAAADRASRLRWAAWVRSQAERLGIGWCYWALGTEFRVMGAESRWDTALLSALLPGAPAAAPA